MKKLLAILLSAVLLFTSVLSASMFTVSAEDAVEPLTDTVVLPKFKDADGYEINLPNTTEKVPGSIAVHPNISVVKNTSKLPFQSLFSVYANRVDDVADVYFEAQPYDKSKGLIFYVEVPNNGEIKNNFDMGTPDDTSDDKEYSTNKFRFGLTLYGYYNEVDPDTSAVTKKTAAAQDYQYGGSWYTMAVGTSSWTESSKSCYGIALDHGFKGYVYVPFGSYQDKDEMNAAQAEGKEAFIDHVMVRGLSNAEAFLADGRQYYGYTDATHPLVFSVPMIVTALDAETSKPAADGVVIDGEKFNYFTDKAIDYSTVNYIPAPTGATTVIATGTVTTDTGETTQTRGYRETIPSTSALTDNLATVKYAHRTNPGRNLNASSSSYNPYPGLIYENDSSNASAAGRSLFDGTVARSSVAGFIFHVTIPATEIKQEGYDWIFDTRQKIQMTFFGANGNSRSMDQAANTSGSWYYLKDGDASWTTVGPESFYKIDAEGNATQEKDTYSLVVGDGTKEWSGYVYVPVKFQNNYGTGIDYFTEIRVGLSSYRHSTGGATSYPTAALAEGFEVSAVSLVSTFSATTTVAIGDNGRIVDLTTGELLENNYGDADEFVGNANLVTKSDDVIAFNHLSNTYSNVMHPATTPISASGKAFNSVPATFDTKMVHSSHPAIKAPMLTAKNNTEEAVAFANTRFLYLNTGVVYAKDYSGVMLYIKNDTSSTKRFNFRTYAYADWDNDPETAVTYKYTYVYGKVSILVDGATAWDNSSDNAVIPANKGAWVYIPLTSFTSQPFGDYLDDPATYWKDIDICTNSTFEKGENVTFSYVMGVTKWTDMNAGVATINGAEVTQNMHSGEFVAPNDYDGNLVTNLIDLVQAKEEASETDFAAFRANYLNTYFNDAEYSVLSASFSVTPLAYNREDASTILSANPERGYRSELFCQFAETPLTIAETPNYKINVGGTNYDITVSANAIRGAKGVVDPTNLDTDYNINHRDMTPYGVGSGGAIHTVPVAAAVAYAKANGLAYATDANLISAAVKMVDEYMQYDYRPYDYENPSEESGMTNIDVSELLRPVYDKEDGYAEMEGAANGSNYGYYKWAKTHNYDNDGNLSEIKLLVAHGRRTIFATDSEEEWSKRWTHMFDQIYAIGSNASCSMTDNFGVVTYENPISNNLFNAYLTFTDYAHKDELSDKILQALDYFFDFCRERNVKSCFRPAYNADYTQNAYLKQHIEQYVQFRNNVASQCADEETMIAHIKQMAPVIAENKDVIHKISSGWIGFGGEMAAGFQYPPVSYKNVITALLDYHCIPNGLYFSSRSSTYYTNIINGIEGDANYNNGLGYGNLDILNGLEADAEWTEKYAKWCGFNNDAFFGDQNFNGWGSSNYYDLENPAYDNDTELAAYAPVDGEMYTNGSHVYNITVDANGVYHWIGDGTTATDNKIPTPMEAIRQLAHHRYTDFSQWHAFLDNVNTKTTTTVMELWQDHDAEWVFEGEVDSVTNGSPFNAEERAAEITKAITKADLEANGILYDPEYFANTDSVNAYEFIRDHLGYRIVVDNVSVNYDERKSDKVNVSVNLKNYGFSAAFNMESTLAIFDKEGNLVQQLATGNPSTWYNLAPDYYTVERTSSAQNDVLRHNISAGFDALDDGTYYVGLKLANTAGAAARLANDVEMNAQGYNILGRFTYASTKSKAPTTLKVMSYNIRCLRGGDSNAGYDPLTGAETAETIANFRMLLSRERPDVMIVCENRMNFDGSATSTDEGSRNVYDNIFKIYFPYAYNLDTGASLPRIYSKYPLSNIEYISVNYASGNGGGRRPLAASINVNGEDIYIVAGHPTAGAEVYETDRVPYFEAIANFAKNKENVIIAGDLNTDTPDFAAELDIFKNGGFTLGNFGEFGTFQTFRYGDTDKYLDNILVKGLEMKNFWVGTETYSDHFPIYSEIYLPTVE